METENLNMKFVYGILETIADDNLGTKSDSVIDAGIVAYVRALVSGADDQSALGSATTAMIAKNKEVA